MIYKFIQSYAAILFLALALSGCAVDGCIDPAATNFDPDATRDDGSCLIEGCTDPLAPNYSEDANVEDGSCLPIPCPEGEQSILTVVAGPNAELNFACAPDITINGDTVAFQLMAGDSVEIELNQGSYYVRSRLPLITACVEEDTLIEAVCGENYRWVPLSD